jgi:2-methylcitrate dehydratase PrpD
VDTFTKRIVDYIEQMSYERLPSAVLDASKRSILDCLGVTLAGRTEDAGRIVSEYIGDSGRPEATVICGGFKTSAEQAAWVNGTSAHALDYDDYFATEQSAPYHPTVAILPAVLAAGEKLRVSGRDVLLAYVTGFEVEARIATVCARQQYDSGWHITSSLGSIGAAAAAAGLLKLDGEKTRIALGIACSLAGGLRKNFGTMTKPLHAGNAARNGVTAVMLARQGFTADRDILDSPLSYFEVLNSQADPKANQETKEGYYIISPGVALKPYPSCAYSHWVIDAALALRERFKITPDNIAGIECRTSSGLPGVLIYSSPKTALEGKFSLEFCTAISLIDGEASLKQFTDDKVRDPVVRELMEKVNYVHPPEMGSGLTDFRGELVIKLLNGEVYSQKVDTARGNPKNPLSQQELIDKYKDCARLSLSPEDTDKSLDLLLNLEAVTDIADLMDIFILPPE